MNERTKRDSSGMLAVGSISMKAAFGIRNTHGSQRWRKGILGLLSIIVLAFAAKSYAAETVTYYYTDHQGSVLATADAAGNLVAKNDYLPYGAQVAGTPTPSGPGYTGHVSDEDTGLIYMQARYYDPVIGRFLSLDPVAPATANVLEFSPYTYGQNNPMVNVDLDGRQSAPPKVVPISTYARSFDVRDDPLLSTVGKAVAADVAFVVGAATNDRQLQETAVDGMAETTSGQAGAEAVVGLMGMGEGEGAGEATVGAGKASTLEPGPYATESIPGHMGKPTAAEQRQVNELMQKNGCHTCGTKDPGTKTGYAVVDHQPPQALGNTTDFYPHCVKCMHRQGGEVSQQKRNQK